MLEDVSGNLDEGCKVLQVHSCYIIHILKQFRVGCVSETCDCLCLGCIETKWSDINNINNRSGWQFSLKACAVLICVMELIAIIY
jgi:hypothetical protein